MLVMCRLFGVSRSGYYDYCKRIGRPEPDTELAEVLWGRQERCRQTYGYRRMWLWLEKQGVHHNPKAVLRVMKKYGLLIVAYKMDTQQTVSLVLDTIRLAKRKEKVSAGRLQLHSDQGSQYTSQAYFDLTKEYGITPSMSRRGNCYDNAMAENFFSILKTECIYRQKLKSFQQARELIDEFIHFYHYERIQLKTGETPLARRLSA